MIYNDKTTYKTPRKVKNQHAERVSFDMKGKRHKTRKWVALAVLLMAAFAAEAQTGYWFIANNNGFSSSDNTNNFYLVPGADPQKTDSSDAYYSPNYNTTPGDPERPLLTTYKTQQDINSIWKVEAVPGETDYYYFQHLLTGKYVIFEPPQPNAVDNSTGYTKRKTMHLQALDETYTLADDRFKFKITGYTNSSANNVNISPKFTVENNKPWYWNPAAQNSNKYNASGGNDGNATNYQGMIGIYSNNTGDSYWHFESAALSAALAPTLVLDCDNKINISTADISGTTIYYSENGGTAILYEGPVTLTPSTTYTAYATYDNGGLTSAVSAGYLPVPYTIAPAIVLTSTTATITPEPGMTLYYTTDGSDPTNTSNTERIAYTGSGALVLAVSDDADLDIRVAASAEQKLPSCEASIAQRLKRPIVTINDCDETMEITNTETNRSYWYAWSLGTNQTAPDTAIALGLYTQYLPGNEIDITSLAGMTTSVEAITLHTFAMNDEGIHSWVQSTNRTLRTEAPTSSYTNTGGIITVTLSSIGDSPIKYSIDGTEPPATDYTGPFTIPLGVTTTVKATTKRGNRETSCIVTLEITSPVSINNLADLQAMATSHSGHFCQLNADIDASDLTTTIANFTGTFDGNYHTLSNLSVPLFGTVNGGTVKNLILSDVTIDKSGTEQPVGAIANQLEGTAKVYNCGILKGDTSYVVGCQNVGGLVGEIAETADAHVSTCYSYATVKSTSTSTGHFASGIVGKIDGSTSARVANCMMYGDIVDGSSKRSPVYGGTHTSNSQNFTEYNYYRYEANLNATDLNDQQAVNKDEYLTRFPFYRHILNTHRELGAYFLFGDYAAGHVAEIGHWVLKPDVAPYPIVERWETNTHRTTADIAANLPETTEDYAGRKLTEMGTDGELAVTVKIGSNTYNINLPITDMDTLHYDFTWGKVVLPFANEFAGWTRDYSKICTGWKITGVGYTGEGNTSVSQTTFVDPDNYNFADRYQKQKDIYDETNNNYIFAQGGNYIVPYGVTDITIEANFANAFYLSDTCYDLGFNATFQNPTNLGAGVPATYHGQHVYTSLATLSEALSYTMNPHQQAVVLVGNYHFFSTTNTAVGESALGFVQGTNSASNKAVTVMSIDEDGNQEPDYGFYVRWWGRMNVPPLRWDFVPIIDIGMAAHVTNGQYYPSIGIWKNRGWFEMTETSLVRMDQFEIDDCGFSNADNGKGNNRWIANSGYFVQIIRSQTKDKNATKLSYQQIGGNAYVKELYPGSHTDYANVTTLRPILVMGGEVEECYMTGYNTSASATGENIYFWCAGGRIHKYLSAYLENPSTEGVNVTAKIDHAVIRRFFGGGTSAAAPITGNINVTIDNSYCEFYCGGPEFGDMVTTGENPKTVTTTANNTVFGEYYGAGFGGTSITYVRHDQNFEVTISDTVLFPLNYTNIYKRLTSNVSYGLGVRPKFEYLLRSGGFTLVARGYTGYARFSLATTGPVTNTLNGCTVKRNFYGGGCQGEVNGNITSVLTDCTIGGSAYGAGYKAENNSVEVAKATAPAYSMFYSTMGVFSDFGEVDYETWTWQQDTYNSYNATNKYLYTDIILTNLGKVSGNVNITIKGTSTVGGSVFGAGDESSVTGNTNVKLLGSTKVQGNVYGGGNAGNVGGNANVQIGGEE